ncbi:uncharacterized protein [Misgurnus anguillicaudatus]|uniref:uncharacterized protein isoform X3 n=1 Tax=Misgurnus anguillicaudatus TaxID=75329 RepID=UPI003CCF3E8A
MMRDMDFMCCKSGTDQGLQDKESTDQTSTESLDSVCNAGEQQQILQTKLNMCSVKLIDCRNIMMKIKTEPTEDKDSHDDNDFISSDVKSELCLDGEITSSTLSCITGGETLSSQRHLERQHTEQKLFTCTRSEISFTTLQEKKLHSEEHTEKKKKFHCQHCGVVCVSLSSLIIHMRTHSGEKPFHCTECGKHFSRKQTLRVHKRIHTGVKPYKCPQCEKRFNQRSHLNKHVLLHTNERPYQCVQCDKTFRDSWSLKSHQNIHSKEKPFQCSDCNKRFSHKANLVVHERLHTGEKPYHCSVCGKSFNESESLVKHLRTHTGERPYKCSHCEKTFTQSSSLNAHQRRLHTREKSHQ